MAYLSYLLDNEIVGVELFFLDSVSQLGPFVVVHALKHGDALEEFLILLSLARCGVFHDKVESITIQNPKVAISLSLDSGGSRCVV